MRQNIPELSVFFVRYFPTSRCYFSDYRSYYMRKIFSLYPFELKYEIVRETFSLNMLRSFFTTPKEFSMKNYSRTNFPREVSVDDMYKPVFVDTQKKGS